MGYVRRAGGPCPGGCRRGRIPAVGHAGDLSSRARRCGGILAGKWNSSRSFQPKSDPDPDPDPDPDLEPLAKGPMCDQALHGFQVDAASW